MAFDKTKPAGTTKIRLSDEEIRANWAALEDALGRNHTFPGVMTSTAGEHTTFELRDQVGDLTQEAGLIKIWNNAGALKFCVPGGTARYLDAVPAAAIMLFGGATAPTGWTKKTDWADKSSLVYTTGTPGAAGTQDPCDFTGIAAAESAHTHQGPSHTHDMASHTHTGPSHTHAGVDHLHSVSITTGLGANWAFPVPGRAGTSGDSAPVDHNHSVSGNTGGADRSLTTGAGGTGASGGPSTNTSGAAGTGATGAGSSHTHALTTPRYQQVIAAVRG